MLGEIMYLLESFASGIKKKKRIVDVIINDSGRLIVNCSVLDESMPDGNTLYSVCRE